MSKHSNRLIVARTSDRDTDRLVVYSENYGKYGATPTEFSNMKDARKVMDEFAAKESRGRTWMVLRIEASAEPQTANVGTESETDTSESETDNG